MEATGVMMTKTTLLAIGQLALVFGQLALYREVKELRYRAHWHTFWFKDGEKVDETISSYEYMETHHG
jgi:hypothetical protein